MPEYLDGFLDETTIKALGRLGLPNFSEHQSTINMWYDPLIGSIYGLGQGQPVESFGRSTEQTEILYSHKAMRPIPELADPVEEMGAALETALASIRAYQEQKQ
ncbi:hypothetical protein HYV87_02900 [Candidatus Woesearchaeota archaeon]|nr:hypothetical protein [Candidatus Woesearchaeota archaeon]